MYLDVPFAEKDQAKALGALWNPDEEIRRRYVPEGVDTTPFKKWFMLESTPIKRGKSLNDGHCWSFVDYGVCNNTQCTFKHFYPAGQTMPRKPLPVYDDYDMNEEFEYYDCDCSKYGEFDCEEEDAENSEEEDENENTCEEQEEQGDACATEPELGSKEDLSVCSKQEDKGCARAQEFAQTRLVFGPDDNSHDDTQHNTVHSPQYLHQQRISKAKALKAKKVVRRTVTKLVRVKEEVMVQRAATTVNDVSGVVKTELTTAWETER